MPDESNGDPYMSLEGSMHEKYTESSENFKLSINTIKQLIIAVRTEAAHDKWQVEQLSKQLNLRELELVEIKRVLEKTQEAKDLLKEESNATKQILSKCDEEKSNFRTDLCGLEAKLADMSDGNAELQKQVVSYEHEVNNLERDLHQCMTEKAQLEQLVPKLRSRIDCLEDELQERSDMLAQSKQITEAMMKDFQDQFASLEKEKCRLEETFDESNDKIVGLEEELSAQQAKCCKLRVQKKKYKEISECVQEQNVGLEEKVRDLEQSNNDLESSLVESESHSKNFSEIEKKLKSRTLQLSKEIEKNVELMKQSELAKKIHENVRIEKDDLQNRCIHLQEAVNELNKSLIATKKEKKNLSDVNLKIETDSSAIVRELNEELDTIRKELNDNRKEIATHKQNHVKMEFMLREHIRKEKELVMVIKQLQTNEETVSKRNEELQENIKSLQEQLKVEVAKARQEAFTTEERSLLRMLTDMKLRRLDNEHASRMQADNDEQIDKIIELEALLKREEALRADDLERIRVRSSPIK